MYKQINGMKLQQNVCCIWRMYVELPCINPFQKGVASKLTTYLLKVVTNKCLKFKANPLKTGRDTT